LPALRRHKAEVQMQDSLEDAERMYREARRERRALLLGTLQDYGAVSSLMDYVESLEDRISAMERRCGPACQVCEGKGDLPEVLKCCAGTGLQIVADYIADRRLTAAILRDYQEKLNGHPADA
jgi:hypothetical protein